MRTWFRNVGVAISTIAQGMYVTLWYFVQTFRRKAVHRSTSSIPSSRCRSGRATAASTAST